MDYVASAAAETSLCKIIPTLGGAGEGHLKVGVICRVGCHTHLHRLSLKTLQRDWKSVRAARQALEEAARLESQRQKLHVGASSRTSAGGVGQHMFPQRRQSDLPPIKKKTLRITRNAASSVNVAEVVKDEAEEEEELRLPVWTRSCSPEGHPGYCYSSSLQKSPKRITHRCSRKSLNDDRE